MLLNTHRLSLRRVLQLTWQTDLIMLVLCAVAYALEVWLIGRFTHIPAAIPTLLGTALAFFIGFNNNQSYSRWWEARTIWGGLVNDSRSWARAVRYYVASSSLYGAAGQDDETIERMIRRHIAFLYALKRNLRGTSEKTYEQFLTEEDRRTVSRFTNIPSALLDLQTRDVQELRRREQIDGFAFLALNELIVRFSDDMGRSERIKGTVFPVMYLYFTRLFIWLLITLLTLVIADEAGAWSIPLGWLVGFVFHVTHISGNRLVNPFDGNPASIPLDSITRTIEINLLELLEEPHVPAPVAAINGEYLL